MKPLTNQTTMANVHCCSLHGHLLLRSKSASVSDIRMHNVVCETVLHGYSPDCLMAGSHSFTRSNNDHRPLPVIHSCLRHECTRISGRYEVASGGIESNTSLRPGSAPGTSAAIHRRCHCVACCSCSPSERRSGTCPAFTFPPLSTSLASMQRCTSLDTGLDRGTYCDRKFQSTIADGYTAAMNLPGEAERSNSGVGMHKSNSLPLCCSAQLKYYSVGISFDAPSSTKQSLSSLMLGDSSSVSIALPSHSDMPTNIVVPGPCMTPPNGSNGSLQSTSMSSVSYLVRSKVSPLEYREKLNSIMSWFGELNSEQRNILLTELLAACEQPQIHLLSLKMSSRMHLGCPSNCEDIVGWLPEAMSFNVLSFLDPVSLCRCSSVSQRWYEIANEPSLWRRLCMMPKWRLSRVSERKQFLRFTLPNGNTDWKGIFAERFRLQNNWLKGRCNVRTFEGHTQGISCLQFDDTRIVSGSSDKTIKLWNIRTNSPWAVQTLVGHSGTVRCLHLEGSRLVSGSTDCTIKVWDLSSQQSWTSIACKVTMVGHMDTVRCLQVDDDKVISGSYDKTLKVWDIKTGQCRSTLRGHEAAVLCVQFDSEKIISGSCDKTIKVWTFSGKCVVTLQGHQDAVTCLQFDDMRIISGSIDCTLRFWDLRSHRSIKVIDWKASEGHTGVVRCLQADSWRVVSASDDRTIKVWSLETGQRLVTLRNHTDGVTCLQFSDAVIVSGSYDKTVKLWDFSCC